MANAVVAQLVIQELLGVKTGDDPTGAKIDQIGDGFGCSKVLIPLGATTHVLDQEGVKWVATTPVPGTAVAYGSAGTQASWTDTSAFVVVQNSAPANGPPWKLQLHSLKILVSGTVPAAATSTQFAVRIDPANRTPTSNATQLQVGGGVPASPVGIFGTNQSKLAQFVNVWVPNAQVPVIPASGANARTVGRGSLRQTISVTLDEYILMFGGPDGPGASAAATAGRFVGCSPSFVLNPQEFCVIHLWQPSATTNPLTCEIELSGWVR